MKDKFEISLLESGKLIEHGKRALVSNAGRVIAVITLAVSALVLFTDISLADFGAKSFSSTLTVMLFSSYLMYFSMSDAGENSGEESEEYRSAKKKCEELSGRIGGDSIYALRQFCKSYSEEELRYRRENLLMRYGYGIDEYQSYRSTGIAPAKARGAFKKADRLSAVPLTPKALLYGEMPKEKSELVCPDRFRFASMLIKLIPSTLCMTLTVSVILTTKDGLTAGDVIDGIFKLSSLIIIGFKGYASGYAYKKNKATLWLETKARLLDAFLKQHS